MAIEGKEYTKTDHASLKKTDSERTLPVLEAAHIKPYSSGGPHEPENGLLLRSDRKRLVGTVLTMAKMC